jgi:hypothetical protein
MVDRAGPDGGDASNGSAHSIETDGTIQRHRTAVRSGHGTAIHGALPPGGAPYQIRKTELTR